MVEQLFRDFPAEGHRAHTHVAVAGGALYLQALHFLCRCLIVEFYSPYLTISTPAAVSVSVGAATSTAATVGAEIDEKAESDCKDNDLVAVKPAAPPTVTRTAAMPMWEWFTLHVRALAQDVQLLHSLVTRVSQHPTVVGAVAADVAHLQRALALRMTFILATFTVGLSARVPPGLNAAAQETRPVVDTPLALDVSPTLATTAMAAAAAVAADPGEWTCSVCEFRNKATSRRCAAGDDSCQQSRYSPLFIDCHALFFFI